MKSPCTGPAWLFCPAHRPERFAKAWAAGAAAVVLDLEDGTPPAAKADARRHALAWLYRPCASTRCAAAKASTTWPRC